jgi:hypothetical protein
VSLSIKTRQGTKVDSTTVLLLFEMGREDQRPQAFSHRENTITVNPQASEFRVHFHYSRERISQVSTAKFDYLKENFTFGM